MPDLVPYLAQRGPADAYVLVVADRTGADVTAVPAEWAAAAARPGAVQVQGGTGHPVHKTATDQWDERHFQNRVDNTWESNACDVAEEAGRQVAAVGADLVIVAGDPRARAMVLDDLRSLLAAGVELVDVREGGRAPGASSQALDGAVHDALLRRTWRRRRELLEHLRQNIGRHAYAASGTVDVLDALRRSQVDTVVLSDDRSSTVRAWIGPEPLQVGATREEVLAFGVADPVEERFDAALLRAVAGSGAGLVVTPNGHDYLREGIAALLRYVDAATPDP